LIKNFGRFKNEDAEFTKELLNEFKSKEKNKK
jgi:hypothetical protein